MFLVYLFVTEVTNPNDGGVCMLCVSSGQDLTRRPRFWCGAEQPDGRERRPACQKNVIGPHLWGQGLCRHNLCRCLQHSNLVHAVSSWNKIMPRFIVCFPIGLDFLFITFILRRMVLEQSLYDRTPFLASTTCVGCSIE